jgi:F-type H+-transporting ATPase subunit alpha
LERAAKMGERRYIVPKGTKAPEGNLEFKGVDGKVHVGDEGKHAAEEALKKMPDHELVKDPMSGGSLTALPIIETQAGDVSAYIPTNVISITDGQIFLESDLFFSGVRPAINVGISVSRVGGNAQIPAMKKIAGTLRLDLAQYREMAAFAQFASDLDAATRQQLERGQRLVEILKQGQYVPQPVEKQVVTIWAANAGFTDKLPVASLGRWESELHTYIDAKQPKIFEDIRTKKKIDDDLAALLKKTLTAFNEGFVAEPGKKKEAAAKKEDKKPAKKKEEAAEEH